MAVGASVARAATVSSLVAAFLWATYYGFVLELGNRASPLALLAYPFLFGGAVYIAWSVRAGHAAQILRLFASPAQWGRALLFLGTQVTVVVVTLQASAEDAALISLVGDVALTPLFVMLFYGEGRDRLRSASFVGGMLLSAGGATLTILASGAIHGISGLALLASPLEAVFIAVYFISMSRAARQVPVDALAAHSALVAGVLALPFTLVLPVTLGSLVLTGISPATLLVATGITSFFVGPALYFYAIGRAGIMLPALLMAAIPVFTLGVAAAFAGQLPPLVGLLGVPIAVLGSFLAVRSEEHLLAGPVPRRPEAT